MEKGELLDNKEEKFETSKLLEIETFDKIAICNPENNARGLHKVAAVLGTGMYGRALTFRLSNADVNACVGSRHHKSKKFNGLPLLSYEQAIASSDIIFLCIPRYAYESVVIPFKRLLRNKTVVDVSNLDNAKQQCNAWFLQKLIPEADVMKALNTVSAYALKQDSFGATRDTFVCGDNDVKRMQLMNLLRDVGLNPIDRGHLHSAIFIERMSFRFFPEWRTAFLILFLTLIPIMLYTFLVYYTDPLFRLIEDSGICKVKRVMAWLMCWLLSLAYLPENLTGYVQIFKGTKYTRFPNWFTAWMKSRKKLQLICLLLALMHLIMTSTMMTSGKANYIFTLPNRQKPLVILYQLLEPRNQWSLVFAVLAFAVMLILGITSLPSVNALMSWKEWEFMEYSLGFASLVLGTLHLIIYEYPSFEPSFDPKLQSVWRSNKSGTFPSIGTLIPILPLLVITLKLVLMLPGISSYLNKIRKGRVCSKSNISYEA